MLLNGSGVGSREPPRLIVLGMKAPVVSIALVALAASVASALLYLSTAVVLIISAALLLVSEVEPSRPRPRRHRIDAHHDHAGRAALHVGERTLHRLLVAMPVDVE